MILQENGKRSIDAACSGLLAARLRVIVAFLSTFDTKLFILRAYQEYGIGGDGFLWFGLQPVTELGSQYDASLLRGYFAITLDRGRGPVFEGFERRMLAQPSTAGSDVDGCDLETDDEGTK